jgi:hypothetical protein
MRRCTLFRINTSWHRLSLLVLDPLIANGIEKGCCIAAEKIRDQAKKLYRTTIDGWEFSDDLGSFGTDYLRRAVVAMTGLGAGPKEDAVHFRARRDVNGERLNGKNHYAIQFEKGQLPPVNAFWSITLYDHRRFFVPNPIHRVAIGDRNCLKLDLDGSLTILVQHDLPTPDKLSNWLPAPAENFTLTMRLYWPKTEILSRTWKPPGAHKLTAAARKAA